MKKRVWTIENCKLLYSEVYKRFGCYKGWNDLCKRPGFDEFCDAMTVITGASSGGAVKLQIRFAVTTQKNIADDQTQTWLRNKYIALECKFIDLDLIPKIDGCKYSAKKGKHFDNNTSSYKTRAGNRS